MRTRRDISRRFLLLGGPALGLIGACGGPANAREMTVYKTPTCGCCADWVNHLRREGFAPRVVEMEDLAPIRSRFGVPDHLSSCHTAMVDGYVVEGHAPASDIKRLLEEQPEAVGLAVPGMPAGSPGMEMEDGYAEAFETILILDRRGAARVFASHP